MELPEKLDNLILVTLGEQIRIVRGNVVSDVQTVGYRLRK